MISRRAGLTATLSTIAVLLGAPSAHASHKQLSIFEDDARLVLSTDASREKALGDLTLLGADTVRVVVNWNRIAPDPNAQDRPDGFDGSDPADYPPENWDRYDGLVRDVTSRGMQVLFSPAGPIPAWASDCHGSVSTLRLCRPNVTQFKRFVQALGTRYSGEYTDENQDGTVLPRVSQWSVWNEPNQGGWLQPQYQRVNGRVIPQSPVIYRDLVRSAVAGLRASGHETDDVLLGETAPLGRVTGSLASRSIAPADFMRDVFCISPNGSRMPPVTSVDLDCSAFGTLRVTGISHHPYTRGGSQPPTTRGSAGEITISSVSRLKTIIRQAAAHHRIPGVLPIYYTEFGFQTDPPDSVFGVPLLKQAAYMNESDWIAYNDPDIRSVAQYQLRDEANLSGFQTGLRFNDGRPKPGFVAYRVPIWITKTSSSTLRIWGQVRPAADHALETVDIQNAPTGGSYSTVAETMTTNAKGFIDVHVPNREGRWRLVWTPSTGGPTVMSRVATVGK